MIKGITLSVMFSLLFSTAAMAADHISQKSIKDINITETGTIYLKTKQSMYQAEFIQHCPVKKYISLAVTSTQDNLGLYSKSRYIASGSKITFLNQKVNKKRKLGSCRIKNLEKIG